MGQISERDGVEPKRRTVSRMTVLLTLFLAMVWWAPARAGYWTVPVNYYDLEDVRYPLASGANGLLDYDNISNQSHATQTPDVFVGYANWIEYVDDATRGRVVKTRHYNANFIRGAYPSLEEANLHGATSFSLWIKADDIKDGQFVAAGGDDRAGYSLTLQNGALVFTYWCLCAPNITAKDQLSSRDLGHVAAASSGWLNVIITQYREDDDESHPQYMAMYVNGVLEARNTNALPASGLWFQFYPGISNVFGYLGSAALKGYVYRPDTNVYDYYSRPFEGVSESVVGLETFFGGLMSEFRLFGHTEFVCSDKTQTGYAAQNRKIEIGSRCNVASDVASISQDRIEPASLLARMPFEQDVRDHHYEGLGKAAVAEIVSPAPTFAEDQLRLYKAKFAGSGVRYASEKLAKLDAAYSVSFWMREPAAGLGNLYRLGDANTGFNIIARGGRVSLVLWRPTTDYPNGACVVVGVDLPPEQGWRHLAFTIDPKPQRETTFYVESAAGVVAYLDGKRVQTQALERFETSGPTVNVGAADHGRDEACRSVTLDAYDGELSDLQVLKAPITAPQAAQLASRFANAAEAVYGRRDLTFAPGTLTERDGYLFRATDPIALGAPIGDFGALELQFTVDFDHDKLPRWKNPVTSAYDPDCEYALSGVEAQNSLLDGPTQPMIALVCFSPERVRNGLTPFTLSFFYRDRTGKGINPRPIDLHVWEPLVSKGMLEPLSIYPRLNFDLKMTFRVSISAYNILVQAKTHNPDPEAPNFVSPIYQGARGLVEAVFGDTDSKIILVTPKVGVTGVEYFFVDQRQQLDDFDVKLSKGY